MHIKGSKTLIQGRLTDNESMAYNYYIIVELKSNWKISRKSTDLDINVQSRAGVVGSLAGLVHHLHLLHHKVCLEYGFLGCTRRVIWV